MTKLGIQTISYENTKLWLFVGLRFRLNRMTRIRVILCQSLPNPYRIFTNRHNQVLARFLLKNSCSFLISNRRAI
jgi:hypothetical protein